MRNTRFARGTTGELFFDGGGAGAALLLAQLDLWLAIGADDFPVVLSPVRSQ